MEQKYAVRPVEVNWICDKCGEAAVQPTGLIQPSNPPHYEHVCPSCQERVLLDKQYPHVTFQRSGEEHGAS
jgi:formylmethanofuran dehydrogenase subunit E